MQKLRIEDIEVDSYETSVVSAEAGTVQANAALASIGGTCISACVATMCTSCESSPWCC